MRRKGLVAVGLLVSLVSFSPLRAEIEFQAHTITGGEFAGQKAISVRAVDIDGDGDLDMLSADLDEGVAWHENDGEENFTTHPITEDADGARSVFAIDVDGDGDTDVLSALDDDRIAWYENDGGGYFITHAIPISLAYPTSVYAADMDGDADVDVLSTSWNGSFSMCGEISWYENDGEENFTAHTIIDSVFGPNSVRAADVDGDGDIDVLSAASEDSEISWYENDGNENFTSHIVTDDAEGARSVYAVDVDGDGDVDVLSACYGEYPTHEGKIAWYENDGDENFSSHTITDNAAYPRSVYAVDIDGDQDIDVLSASEGLGIAWHENDGNESFDTHVVWEGVGRGSCVYAVDVNGDGNMDVLSTSVFNSPRYEGEIAWHENNGNESFHAHVISEGADGATSVHAADVDSDGDTDVLSASELDDEISWYENDGEGNFSTHTITDAADGATSVYAADVDGDGDIDVLSASMLDDTIAWYENDGNENFITHIIVNDAEGAFSVSAVDMDSDGDMDVLSASYWHNEIPVAWYENDGNENFTRHSIADDYEDAATGAYATDLDRDGDMDVVSSSHYDHGIKWYENDGAEHFTTHPIIAPRDYYYSIYAVDVDNDQDIDVLSVGLGNRVLWSENNGNENFSTHYVSDTADEPQSVYAVDVDGDGDMDVLSASYDDAKIAWYENLPASGIAVQDPSSHPNVLRLSSISPNPFRHTTAILFDLPKAIDVKMSIHDVSGRVVMTEALGMLDAGSSRYRFDGSDLPSGTYFFRLDAEPHSAVRPMVLVK